MATYQFSTLADGQTISFNPAVDMLWFDGGIYDAADIRVVTEGTDVRLFGSPFGGKSVVLLDVSPLQLASGNVTTGNGSLLLFGDNTPGTANDNAANVLNGSPGDDQLAGFGGADTLNGGAGNDTYLVGAGDVLSDTGGVETVISDVSWTLGAAFEHLTLSGTANISATGNNLDNLLEGNSGNNYFNARGGNDTIRAGAGNDTIDMSTGGTPLQGSDSIDGGFGIDTVDYDGYARSALVVDLANGRVAGGGDAGEGQSTMMGIERFIGGAFSDRIDGHHIAGDYLDGRAGNDTIDGGGGNDTLIGGAGFDLLSFTDAPGSGNADQVIGFVSGTDKLVLDGAVHANLGATGNFAAGDARFWASASGTAHDANDRVVYNTGTGQLWYDADGNGAGAAQLIATLQGAPSLAATDMVAVNNRLVGTNGNDSLAGGGGEDTIEGLGGNDTLDGGADRDWLDGGDGNDLLLGGDGSDSLRGGAGADTLNGGLGNDSYDDVEAGDVLSDPGGTDFVFSTVSWTLGAGFESIRLLGSAPSATGNELTNYLLGNDFNNALSGLAGSDTLDGAGGNDTLNGGAQNDNLTGGAGADVFAFDQAPNPDHYDTITDFTSGSDRIQLDGNVFAGIGMSGAFSTGDERFKIAVGGNGTDPTDRIVYDPSSGHLFYDFDGSGTGIARIFASFWPNQPTVSAADFVVVNGQSGAPQTINGTAGNDSLVGGPGNDTINGLGGDDSLFGVAGNDSLSGGDGNDLIDGGEGGDTLVGGSGNDFMYGQAGNDSLAGGIGNDEILAGAGNDTIDAGEGNDVINVESVEYGVDSMLGGAGSDTLSIVMRSHVVVDAGAGTLQGGSQSGGGSISFSGFESFRFSGNWTVRFTAGDGGVGVGVDEGNATLIGGAGADNFNTGMGNDYLDGGGGVDFLHAASGRDMFAFTVTPGAANADRILNFSTGEDTLRFDGAVYTAIGPSGRFIDGDARFWTSSLGTAHDADDRIIYNPGTGEIWYDADGTGAIGRQLVATLVEGGAGPEPLFSGDIEVINGGGGGQTVNGTAGNDSLVGTTGDDTISGFGGNDSIDGKDGADRLDGGAGNDSLNGGSDEFDGGSPADVYIGGEGNDTLDGWVSTNGDANAETMDGGLGDDLYYVDNEADVLTDAGGTDTVYVWDRDWTLGAGFENILVVGLGGIYRVGIGNELDNFMEGGDYVRLEGRGGNDTLEAGGRNNILLGDEGNDHITGGDYDDTLEGGSGNDTLLGGWNTDLLSGGEGDDRLDGNGGFIGGFSDLDQLTGGAGADSFAFTQRPDEFNRSLIMDFASGIDSLRLDATVMNSLGGSGRLASGDGRFYAAAGATSGHDADDRLIYNTSTRDLYYDADGNGSQQAFRLATLQSGATLASTDIVVDNGTGGQHIVGTGGNDSLAGTNGNDTLDGLGGVDTMNGGAGNDLYIVTAGDVTVEAVSGGFDRVESATSWALANEVEDLTLTGTAPSTANGNNLANVLRGNDANNSSINGRAGNDTMFGMGGNDVFDMSTGGTSSYGSDVIDGGAGTDSVEFGNNSRGAVNINLTAGTVSGGGDAGAGSATLAGIENALGGNFNDTLTGNSGANLLRGWNGNDTLNGKAGVDRLNGGAGNDSFVFDLLGSANRDIVEDFASGADKLRMENSVMTAIGATGNFAAGDARFWAAAGATSGHDANDRIVYNSTTGDLYYDADGSGGGAAQFVGNISGHPAIAATDIAII